MHFDRGQLAALAAIMTHGSFEAAAQHLGVTQSAISQRIKALEESVGTVLVLRETPCRGTEAGQRLAAHAEAIGLLEAQTLRDLGRSALDRTGDSPARLRLAINADSLATWFLPALDTVEGVMFDITVDDEGFSADALRRGEAAAAVTTRETPVQGCDVVPLGALRYIATASPGYIDHWLPDGVTAQSMARAPMLRFDRKDDLQTRWLAEYVAPGLTPPSHRLPSTDGFTVACRRGLGWGMNPEALVSRMIHRGVLAPLRPHTALDRPLFWQSSRLLAPALAPLTAAVQAAARAVLIQPKG